MIVEIEELKEGLEEGVMQAASLISDAASIYIPSEGGLEYKKLLEAQKTLKAIVGEIKEIKKHGCVHEEESELADYKTFTFADSHSRVWHIYISFGGAHIYLCPTWIRRAIVQALALPL